MSSVVSHQNQSELDLGDAEEQPQTEQPQPEPTGKLHTLRQVFGNSYSPIVKFVTYDPPGRDKIVTFGASELRTIDPYKFFDRNEQLLNLRLYKVKLSDFQRTYFFFFHSYIVFETRTFWWSLEKNTEGVTVQRSRRLDDVRNKYRGKLRKGLREDCSIDAVERDTIGPATGPRHIEEVFQIMGEKQLVAKAYHIIKNNCKDFSRALFNEFALQKTWSSGKGQLPP